jgi:hypothetical protein
LPKPQGHLHAVQVHTHRDEEPFAAAMDRFQEQRERRFCRQRHPLLGHGRRRYAQGPRRINDGVDALHSTLSGPATKKLMERACQVFADAGFERLAGISVSNLRRAPQTNGLPGYIRIDSVHQGDQDGVKGVYHLSAVGSVPQF